MAVSDENARITITIPKVTLDKMNFFAERFEVSQSRMATILIESMVEDNELFLKVVSNSFVQKASKAIFGDSKKAQKHANKLVIDLNKPDVSLE